MKTLPLKLTKNTFEYTQVCRGKRSCIYKQRVTENCYAYEVFKIKIRPERILKGKILPEGERFPHDEAFGYWAWSYTSFEDAVKKYEELENNN